MKTYKQIKTIGMKKLQLLCLLMLAFFTFSCYDDSDILGRLDAMESDRVASIETQIAAAQSSIEALQAADVALDKYIDALEAKSDSLAQALQNSDQQLDNRIDEVYEMTMKEFALVNAELQALNSQDSLLNVRLTELNDYIAQVEAQQKAEHDWVQQTFSTLEQYEATCAAIAGLEAHLQTVDGELLDLTKALEQILGKRATLRLLHHCSDRCQDCCRARYDDARKRRASPAADANARFFGSNPHRLDDGLSKRHQAGHRRTRWKNHQRNCCPGRKPEQTHRRRSGRHQRPAASLGRSRGCFGKRNGRTAP